MASLVEEIAVCDDVVPGLNINIRHNSVIFLNFACHTFPENTPKIKARGPANHTSKDTSKDATNQDTSSGPDSGE